MNLQLSGKSATAVALDSYGWNCNCCNKYKVIFWGVLWPAYLFHSPPYLELYINFQELYLNSQELYTDSQELYINSQEL